MKFFVKISGKSFILDVWQGSEYASEWDLRQEKRREQLFSRLESMHSAHFFHWFQAGYAYKHYMLIKRKHVASLQTEAATGVVL